MIVKQALHDITQALAAHNIEDARLEAEVLLMHFLGIDRAGLYARLENELLPGGGEALEKLVERRIAREPLAYIIGHREFYGRDFNVAPGVLIPRPETELLVEETLEFAMHRFPDKYPVIAEVGTGSGCVAISVALEIPGAAVYATDISPRALEIAAYNCEMHKAEVRLLLGDLLDPVPETVDVVIANLPYVRDEEIEGLSDEIRAHEPMLALAGGPDGMDNQRRLLEQIAASGGKLSPGGLILLEVGPAQGRVLASFSCDLFPSAEIDLIPDISGMPRALRIVLT